MSSEPFDLYTLPVKSISPGHSSDASKKDDGEFTQYHIKDVAAFARWGLQEMEIARGDGIIMVIKKGESFIKKIASDRGDPIASRLARVALKVSTPGDSTLSDLLGEETDNDPSRTSKGDAQFRTYSILYEPIEAVYRAALETLSLEMDGPLGFIIAATGIKAMKILEKSKNPMSPALAGEPFLLGAAECERRSSNRRKFAEFIQEEISPALAIPANFAYMTALNILSGDVDYSHGVMLAKVGSGIVDIMSGNKEIAAMAEPFLCEISASGNVMEKKLADRVMEIGGDLADADGADMKTRRGKARRAFLYKTCLNMIAVGIPGDPASAAMNGLELIWTLEKHDPPFRQKDMAGIGEVYISVICRSSEEMKPTAIGELTRGISRVKENGEPAAALYRAALEELSVEGDKLVDTTTFRRIAARSLENLDDSQNPLASAYLSRHFIGIIKSCCKDPEINNMVDKALKSAIDTGEEDLVVVCKSILQKMASGNNKMAY